MPAPIGNQNARKKPWANAIQRAIAQHGTPDVLFKLATQMIDKALIDHDQFSLKEIADRVDGKAVQATELTGADGKDLFRQSSEEELDARIAELEAKRK